MVALQRFFQVRVLLVALICQFAFAAMAKGDFLDLLNLPSGTQYRVLLVTAGTISGSSQDINVYNQFATSQANQAPAIAALGTTWSALLSTPSTNAVVNTNTQPSSDPLNPAGVVIVRYDGVKIVDNYNDLWDGSIDHVIEMDQLGNTFPYHVWTGTRANGSTATGFELGAAAGYVLEGSSSTDNSAWMDFFPVAANNPGRIYALSGTLVAVPEPSALITVTLAIAVVCWLGYKRREGNSTPSISSLN